MAFEPSLASVVGLISRRCSQIAIDRALLVGISGIDGSGKGFVAERLQGQLERMGWRVALIGADPLQNPLTVRLSETAPDRHFYEHVFRWDELFGQVVDPLVASRSIDVMVNAIRGDVDRYYPLQYRFEDVDIVLLEGIFLFKRALAARFDLKLWVDCTFETALARAHQRNQEGQPSEVIERDYGRVYHAAQRLHLRLDEPREVADAIVANDPALTRDRTSTATRPDASVGSASNYAKAARAANAAGAAS